MDRKCSCAECQIRSAEACTLVSLSALKSGILFTCPLPVFFLQLFHHTAHVKVLLAVSNLPTGQFIHRHHDDDLRFK
jgi:hypothetical protein